MPPPRESRIASVRNWSWMLRLRAPRARRMPISRVRSTTDTSMMFVITMPPTTSEIPEMKTITAKLVAEMLFHNVCSASAETTPNGSSPRNGVLRRLRRITRT